VVASSCPMAIILDCKELKKSENKLLQAIA